MFRIDRTANGDWMSLTLEGDLNAESVPAAESACRDALSCVAQVDVLLRNVTEIDAEGCAFLRRLVATKARVRADGIYSEYVLGRMQPGRTAGL